MKQINRQLTITARVNERERDIINEAAAREGMAASTFMRVKALAAARETDDTRAANP
jgi:uncharacterized protein (DUF1778 family)